MIWILIPLKAMNYLEKAFETVVPSTGENTCTVVIIITRTFVTRAINANHDMIHVDTFQSFSQVLLKGPLVTIIMMIMMIMAMMIMMIIAMVIMMIMMIMMMMISMHR